MPLYQEGEARMEVPKKNIRIGLCLILTPFIGLLLILSLYAITTFVISSLSASLSVSYHGIIPFAYAQSLSAEGIEPELFSLRTDTNDSDLAMTVGSLIKVALGFFGVVFLLWIFIGVPIGIYFLTKKEPVKGAGLGKRISNGGSTDEIEGIHKWNWGAFFLGWIWGISNGVWISFVTMIPIVGFIFRFYLGIDGNRLAWKNKKWDSVESFHNSQRNWAIAGVVVFFCSIAYSVLAVVAQMPEDNSVNASTSYSVRGVEPSSVNATSVPIVGCAYYECPYKGDCVSLPANGHCVDDSANAWRCDDGYSEVQDSCIVAKTNNQYCVDLYGSHGVYNSSDNSCGCTDGYYYGEISKQCVSLVTSRNEGCEAAYPGTNFLKYDEMKTTNICECKPGYIWNNERTACNSQTSLNATCENAFGLGSYSVVQSGSQVCDCRSEYAWNPTHDSCILIAYINTICERDIGRNSEYAGSSSNGTFDCTQPY